jgi:hypothetical protein
VSYEDALQEAAWPRKKECVIGIAAMVEGGERGVTAD